MDIITVIGSLNMDLVINTPRIPQMGETITGSGFMVNPGGKGANQAVAVAKLNGNIYMVGCVGDDFFGKDLLKNLSENGVNVSNIKIIEGASTGIAIIVLKEGDNFIILDSGANYCITQKHIGECHDLIKRSSLIIVQLEIPFDVVEKAVNVAKEYKVKVLFNPAPAKNISDNFLSKIDIILLNETESELITGIHIRTIDDAKETLKFLRNKGILQVIITMGSNGVVYNSGERLEYKPAYPVKDVMDTTAAGDSFIGAFAVAITNGLGIDEAVDFAIAASAITVTKKGAQVSLPTLNEVNKLIKKDYKR